MIRLQSVPEGTVVPVRARAGARRNGITGQHDGALRISVTVAPEKGRANQAVAAVLSKALHLPKSSVELKSGLTSQNKKFLLRDVLLRQVRTSIDELLSDVDE